MADEIATQQIAKFALAQGISVTDLGKRLDLHKDTSPESLARKLVTCGVSEKDADEFSTRKELF